MKHPQLKVIVICSASHKDDHLELLIAEVYIAPEYYYYYYPLYSLLSLKQPLIFQQWIEFSTL